MVPEVMDRNEAVLQKEGTCPGGIILSFDDYSPSWQQTAVLLEKGHAHATFYISLEPTELGTRELILLTMLLEKGHEIAWHTATHPDLNQIPESERPDAMEREILEPLQVLGESIDTEIHSFAYPYGFYDEDWEDRLSGIFTSRRGFGRIPQYYSVYEIEIEGFFKAVSIDNAIYRKREDENEPGVTDAFKSFCQSVFYEIQTSSRYIILGSHGLGKDPWGITPENLDYLLAGAEKRGIPILSLREARFREKNRRE